MNADPSASPDAATWDRFGVTQAWGRGMDPPVDDGSDRIPASSSPSHRVLAFFLRDGSWVESVDGSAPSRRTGFDERLSLEDRILAFEVLTATRWDPLGRTDRMAATDWRNKLCSADYRSLKAKLGPTAVLPADCR